MQEWLRPILNESIGNGRDLQRLKEQLDLLSSNYREIEATFDAARTEEEEG
jgi:hypothetical protein